MSRRIVVGLDGTAHAKVATEMACLRSLHDGGAVVGVGIVDVPGIESCERGAPIMAGHLAQETINMRIAQADESVDRWLAEFARTCELHHVRYECVKRRGHPHEALIAEAITADLLVVGIESHFNFSTQDKPGDTVRALLKRAVCPVLAVTDKFAPPEHAVIAYDGSIASARAMRSFVTFLSPVTQRLPLTLLGVGSDPTKIQPALGKALDYLHLHGFEAEIVVRVGKPDHLILEESLKYQPAILVMGAFGKNAVKSLLFGSTARRVMENGNVPLFVFH